MKYKTNKKIKNNYGRLRKTSSSVQSWVCTHSTPSIHYLFSIIHSINQSINIRGTEPSAGFQREHAWSAQHGTSRWWGEWHSPSQPSPWWRWEWAWPEGQRTWRWPAGRQERWYKTEACTSDEKKKKKKKRSIQFILLVHLPWGDPDQRSNRQWGSAWRTDEWHSPSAVSGWDPCSIDNNDNNDYSQSSPFKNIPTFHRRPWL